jgi:hypothetical protein
MFLKAPIVQNHILGVNATKYTTLLPSKEYHNFC